MGEGVGEGRSGWGSRGGELTFELWCVHGVKPNEI